MVSETLIAASLLYASHFSGLPIPPNEYPKVIIEHLPHPELSGRTNILTKVISLSDKWKGNQEDVCVLTHELTHFLQLSNKNVLDTSNVMNMEKQAYEVEIHCLRDYGLNEKANFIQENLNHAMSASGAYPR